MGYKMFENDLKEIIAEDYFTPFNRDYLAKEKMIAKRYGDFRFKETHLRNEICISECKYGIDNSIKLQGTGYGDFLCLTFMNKGYSYFDCKNISNCKLAPGSYNLFYLCGEVKAETELVKGEGNDAVDIVVSKDYIGKMTEKYPEVFEYLYKRIEQQRCFALHENGIYADIEMHRIIHCIKEADNMGKSASLYIEAKILELFALLSCNMHSCKKDEVSCLLQDKMFEVKAILENNFNTPPSLQELAREVGVSGTTMKNCFKKMFNTTVYGYLFDFRMNKAETLLKYNKELNVTEIADLTGYEHPAHFCTAFKRKFGITPGDYREKLRV